MPSGARLDTLTLHAAATTAFVFGVYVGSDYLFVGIQGGYPVVGVDLGAGQVMLMDRTSYVADNNWQELTVALRGAEVTITVLDNPPATVIKLNPLYQELNVKGQVEVQVGGALDEGPFVGLMESLLVDGHDVLGAAYAGVRSQTT